MSHFPHLFSAGRIGALDARNRLVMPPMVRNYADSNGCATPRYQAHIERIARGGVGCIILEAAYVRQDGKGFSHQLGLHDDAVIEPLRELVNAGHRHGALMGIQVFHGGRQAGSVTSNCQPVAPSPLPDPVTNEVPRELSVLEIGELVEAFANGARRAFDAGCDFIELHGAHGYLIAQFLSPFANRRNDDYGGSAENRRRFLEEVFLAVRQAVGEDFPIILRLSAEERIPGGLPFAETLQTAIRMEELGVDALHVSTGSYATYAQGEMIAPMAKPDGLLKHYAREVKQAVGIPVITVGKLRSPEEAEATLAAGEADFIAIGRSLLADPDWPAKAEIGSTDRIRPCVACNQGCIGRLFAQLDVWCTVNPECGREETFANWPLLNADRKLAIVGAGPAGMTAALLAADAGFKVDLFDAADKPGGQLHLAAIAPHRGDWERYRAWLAAEIQYREIHEHYGKPARTRDITGCDPWAIIVATGSRASMPDITMGPDHIPLVTSREILAGGIEPEKEVVVAGAGCSGAQTAEYIAEYGARVTLIEAGGEIAGDAPVDDRMLLLGRLQEKGVNIMPHTRLLGVEHEGALVHSPEAIRTLPADMIVLCLGANAETEIADALSGHDLRMEIIGDARSPRRVTDAVHEAADAVSTLVRELAAEKRCM